MKNIRIYILVAAICVIFATIIIWWQERSEQKSGPVEGSIKIHMIDVGQGDAIVIQTGKENILIDGGTKSNGQTIINYLKNNYISTLDTIISTHPDADHIGGLADVIDTYEITNVYAPRVTHTTQAYEDFLRAVQKQQLKIKVAKANILISTTVTGLQLEFISPAKAYSESNLNNWSAVLKVRHGENTMLFMGDAETAVENDLLENGALSKITLLKVSHHGATEASTKQFLKMISPEYALISVGENNRYGHPTKATLKRLHKSGAKIYRTDEQGSLVATSNGTQISIETEQ